MYIFLVFDKSIIPAHNQPLENLKKVSWTNRSFVIVNPCSKEEESAHQSYQCVMFEENSYIH